MQRTYQYRLYPTPDQQDTLNIILLQSCLLYNEALAHRRSVHKHTGQSVSYYDQWRRFKEDRKVRVEDFGLLNATSVQQLLRRLDKSFASFFGRIKAGEKAGFPRFKPATRFRSVEYRHGDGCMLRGGALAVQHVGDVRIKLHRPVPENCLKQAIITRKAGNRWFVSFQGDDGRPAPPLKSGKAIGIDLGLLSLLALSDGTLIDNPRWLRRSLRTLRRTQRAFARKTRFSARWWQTKRQLETLHWRVSNQRRHFLHTLTDRLTQEFALIAVENVSPAFMLHNRRLALSAADASWHLFRSMLDYKAERAGSVVVEVDASYTSQACSKCGCVKKKSLSQRWHSCECGAELDRDVNAAVNILNKARSGLTEHNVDAVGSCVLRQKADAL